MTWHKDAPGYGTPGAADETTGGGSSSLRVHPVVTSEKPCNIQQYQAVIDCLTDRILAAWIMKLSGIDPLECRGGYLFRELMRLEVRRRKAVRS